MKYSFITFLFLTIIFSCQDQDEIQKSNGRLKFSFLNNNSGRTTSGNHPRAVLASIMDSHGNSQMTKLDLYSFGSEFISEDILLPVGTYLLTQFVILNDSDSVIYATPIEGSEMAQYVEDPLPINFSVSENGNTIIKPQVLEVNGDNASEFGYAAFGFEVVEPKLLEQKIYDYNGSLIHRISYTYQGGKLFKRYVMYCGTGTADTVGIHLFSYSGGKLKSIKTLYNDTIVTSEFEYESGRLSKYYDYTSNNYVTEYFYDSNGIPTKSIRKMMNPIATTAYVNLFSVDSNNMITTVQTYFGNTSGEIIKSYSKVEYEYGQGKYPAEWEQEVKRIDQNYSASPIPVLDNTISKKTLLIFGETESDTVVFCVSRSSFDYNNKMMPIKETLNNDYLDLCFTPFGPFDGGYMEYRYGYPSN